MPCVLFPLCGSLKKNNRETKLLMMFSVTVDCFLVILYSNTTPKLQIKAVEVGKDKRLSFAGRRVYPESRKTQTTRGEK